MTFFNLNLHVAGNSWGRSNRFPPRKGRGKFSHSAGEIWGWYHERHETSRWGGWICDSRGISAGRKMIKKSAKDECWWTSCKNQLRLFPCMLQLRLFPPKKTNSFVGQTRKLMFRKPRLSLQRLLAFQVSYFGVLQCWLVFTSSKHQQKLWWIREFKTESWDLWAGNSCQNPMIFSTCSMPRRCCFFNLTPWRFCFDVFLQTQWHDLDINTFGTLVGWLEPHVWKIWVKMGFLPSRGETNNFWNHHLKLHCNIGVLVDLLNICGRSCLKIICNLYAGLQHKNNHMSLVTSHLKPVHA